jgi:hypothetical protein
MMGDNFCIDEVAEFAYTTARRQNAIDRGAIRKQSQAFALDLENDALTHTPCGLRRRL